MIYSTVLLVSKEIFPGNSEMMSTVLGACSVTGVHHVPLVSVEQHDELSQERVLSVEREMPFEAQAQDRPHLALRVS